VLLFYQGGSSPQPPIVQGSSDDFARRVKKVLPARWFGDSAPIAKAIIGGLADLASWSYSLLAYARQQSRIATATGPWLDLISKDFLGDHLMRYGLSDATFRTRIKATILQERVTRNGMISALTTLTGYTPSIFEPWNTYDAGGYDGPGAGGYDCGNYAQYGGSFLGGAGGYGDTNVPGANVWLELLSYAIGGGYDTPAGSDLVGSTHYIDTAYPPSILTPTKTNVWFSDTVFMTVYRPAAPGIPGINGYDGYLGGYDAGAIEYADNATALGGLTDAMIYDTINLTRPTGSLVWVNLVNGPPPQWISLYNLIGQDRSNIIDHSGNFIAAGQH
jgi:hypothetical protein